MTKPTLRKDVLIQFYDAWRSIVWKSFEENAEINYPFRNCLNCEHFTESQDICRLYNVTPPAKVICYGCEKHCEIGTPPY